jgi:hypothetical protein
VSHSKGEGDRPRANADWVDRAVGSVDDLVCWGRPVVLSDGSCFGFPKKKFVKKFIVEMVAMILDNDGGESLARRDSLKASKARQRI